MTEPTSNSARLRVIALPTSIGLAAVATDRVSKVFVEETLRVYDQVAVLGDYVRLVLWYNEGAAFGIRLGGQWVHVTLSCLAMALVGYMIWNTPREDRFGLAGFGLIMGGAVGNLWDRVVTGRVTDFIDVGIGTYRWPTFNVADSCVVVGIGMLLVSYVLNSRGATDDEGHTVSGTADDETGLTMRGGEMLVVRRPDRREPSATPEDIPVDVRYEDDDLLVVNKPAGQVVHPAPGHPGGTLVNALTWYCSKLSSVGGPIRPGIIHRLDKDTSGLLLVAKNDRAHKALAEQLAAREISREYRALVWGHPRSHEGTVDAPVGRSTRDGTKMTVGGRSPRDAVTRFEVLESLQYTSWLALRLQTGRTHQIRVHMRHIGHPVVGDPDYDGRVDRASVPAFSERAAGPAAVPGAARSAPVIRASCYGC